MPQRTKIATCCYCGTRAALVLRGQERHELACSACGAPLHNLKMLPVPEPSQAERPARPAKPRKPAPRSSHEVWQSSKRPGKKRKGLGRRFLEEAFDLIEDVFD